MPLLRSCAHITYKCKTHGSLAQYNPKCGHDSQPVDEEYRRVREVTCYQANCKKRS